MGEAYWSVMGRRGQSKVKSYSTSGRSGKTTIRVEIEVSNAYEVSDILRQLHDAQSPTSPKGDTHAD